MSLIVACLETWELKVNSCSGQYIKQCQEKVLAAQAENAKALGLAFQIADDILDETGDEAKAGKRLQKDAEAGKATFVSLLGLDGARQRATDLVTQACDALSPYGDQAESLREAARFVISRES